MKKPGLLAALFGLAAFAFLAGVLPPSNAATLKKPMPVPTPRHTAVAKAAPAAPVPNGEKLLADIRKVFRSHRPPPAYETYTLDRVQKTEEGYPDYAETYTYHIWLRGSDRAALGRKVFRDDYRGPLEFLRPAFNEPYDPGPPTADVFEPAPAHPIAVEVVPTPEAAAPAPIIGEVHSIGETQYHVTHVAREGSQYHVSVFPIRDKDRNRLREIYVDSKTLELQKLVATDKLFVQGDKVYGVTFTYTMTMLEGRPVVTDLHGIVGDDYVGNGAEVDYHFTEITFPASLPSWYFDPHTYAGHREDAPT